MLEPAVPTVPVTSVGPGAASVNVAIETLPASSGSSKLTTTRWLTSLPDDPSAGIEPSTPGGDTSAVAPVWKLQT
jgi:hypothetical protein